MLTTEERFAIIDHPFAEGKKQLVDFTMNMAMTVEGENAVPIVAALLADLKLYKKAVEEARTLMRNGDIDRYLKFCPALATVLKEKDANDC